MTRAAAPSADIVPPKTKSRPAAKKTPPPARARLFYYIHPPDRRYLLRRVALNDQTYDKKRLAGLELAMPAIGRALRLYGDVIERDYVFDIPTDTADRPSALVVDISFSDDVVAEMVRQARALKIPVLVIRCHGYFGRHTWDYQGRHARYYTYRAGESLLKILYNFCTPLPHR